MKPDDLADFSAEWVEPISINYHGWKVYELPPNGQGMAALEMLNIMSTLPPDKAGPLAPMELHNRIEAMKLAYSDLYRYNADPRFAKVPVKGLLAPDYAKQRASLIDPAKANCTPASGSPARSDTTYLAAVDKDRRRGPSVAPNRAGRPAIVRSRCSRAWRSSCSGSP